MIGQTLNHYQISEKLGAGGMGAVYRARDQKLGRDVAIKVLPEEFAKDADRISRFQREAKLLASLNHPNIAAIYGLEESGGTNFLVLELVEGETLADQLKRGPIPVEESLKLALQIAEALEAAHEKGVIHRDLKPANIKVTPDGKVKVLDFGLAKAFAGEQADRNLSNSPTLSNAATQQGVILGTAAYMSPEQARGESVDKKADIWAFGCVLFEMLTGHGTFEGRTVSDVLASVIKSEPAWNRLPPNLHPRIRLLLERCLEKEAKNRYSGIGDARVDIQKALADPGGVFAQPFTTVEPRRKLRTIMPWVAAAIVLTAIIAGLAVWKFKPPEPHQVTRLSYELPMDQQFGHPLARSVAVSPDGRQFVYSTGTGLYLRSMDELDAKFIAGTEGAQRPFFSPDGKWIGYFSAPDSQLKKIAVNGGAPVALTIVDNGTVGYFSWGADDRIVYASVFRGIMRVSSNGGTPEMIAKAENETILCPQMLPDGKSVLFTLATRTAPRSMKVAVQSLKSGERKVLFAGSIAPFAQYLPIGHIVYAEGNNLLAVPFDPEKVELTGGPVSLPERVYRLGFWPQYAVSDSGTLVYVPEVTVAAGNAKRTLVWVDRNGKEDPLAAQPDGYANPRISPDGTQMAMTIVNGENASVWVRDLVRQTMTRLTLDKGIDVFPLWTRDGKQIAYLSFRPGSNEVYSLNWKAANGTGKEELISSGHIIPASWSGDGKTLVLTLFAISGTPTSDIGALSMEGDRTIKPLLQGKYAEAYPRISPDGRWMAYTSDESGQAQIYVRPFPEVDRERWPVSTSGGYDPLWSPDGQELFYRNADAIMVVPVKTKPTFTPESPKILFRGMYTSPSDNFYGWVHLDTWDISRDGKRFLMIKESQSTPSAAQGPRKINIVLNWFEELKQRVPKK